MVSISSGLTRSWWSMDLRMWCFGVWMLLLFVLKDARDAIVAARPRLSPPRPMASGSIKSSITDDREQ